MKYMHVRGRRVCCLSPLLRHCVVLGEKSRNEWGGDVYTCRAPPQELFKLFESMSLSPSDWPRRAEQVGGIGWKEECQP